MSSLYAFGEFITGKITADEFHQKKKERQREVNQRIIKAIEAEYGSMDNYLHHRALEKCNEIEGRIATKRR